MQSVAQFSTHKHAWGMTLRTGNTSHGFGSTHLHI